MSTNSSRQFVTVLLIFGAVIFGMVLAGGVNLTPPTLSSPQPGPQVAPAATAQVPSFADLAEAVLPAVVSVDSVTIDRNPRGRFGDPFEFFMPRSRPREREPREYRSEGAGSGFVISADGWIVTNNHVIAGATQVKVGLEGREFEAQIKGVDPSTDLALLKLETDHDLKYLALGDSEVLRVGDWVMAIGNPYLLDHSVTVGVVSAKGRQIGLTRDSSFENFIQTDAAINRGNSGGPLVNTRGEVVGISTAMNYGAENIGFAVPVNILRQILPQLRSEGRVRRGYLGVNITNLDYEGMEYYGLDSTDGALVDDVVEDSPADDAGVRPGDIILKVDDAEIVRTRDLIDYVSNLAPGSEITLDLLRNGKRVPKKVSLGERPGGETDEEEDDVAEGETEWLGLQVQELTPAIRSMHEIPQRTDGVWVTDLAPSSPLQEKRVLPGDIIAEVNGEPISSVRDFERQVGQVPSGRLVRLYILRFQQGNRAAFSVLVRVP